MNTLLDNEEDEAPHRRDREITLGTSTVLGIFFALAILCAAFFGFGYSLGSKHTSPTVNANGDAVSTRPFSTFKPAPGSPLNSVATSYAPTNSAPPPGPLPTTAAPSKVAAPGTTAPPEAFEAEQPVVKTSKLPAVAAPVVAAVAPAAAAPAMAPAGQLLVVQVAALSHQEDAELIRTTLERRGYTVAIRSDAQDKLLHVQIGPFNNRKDAEAMRQKLLADGFNAYIK